MGWEPARDAYAAGLIDGEGCFLINRNRRSGRQESAHPRFTLNLRADDVEVLRQLSVAFGGRLSLSGVDRAPRYFWHVTSKADLRRLVAYLDEFPLRAKKRHDYALWRQAVELYAAHGGVGAYEQLMLLRAALIGGRVFDGSQTQPQLRRVV